MKESMMKYFRVIGQIHSVVEKADNLEEALKSGLHIILDTCGADGAVIWYEDKEGDKKLHPYYWICPLDFTSKTQESGNGIVGGVYSSGQRSYIPDYRSRRDAQTDDIFKGLDINSMVCVPLETKYEKMGVLQFINTGDSKPFTDEEADICEIMASMIALGIDENQKLWKSWKTSNVILSVRDIKRSFKNGEVVTQVLKGVNLDVYEGEFLALLGESGCGKSTLLNIIGGMDQADSGSFTYMGKDLSKASQAQLTDYRRDNIGFIFQNYNLMPNLNASQNLNLIGELVKDPLSADEALELVGLKERKKNYPSQLSGGQQQRVSIARALVKKPKLIFADEPTAALDYTTSIEVLSVLEKVVAAGTTLVMVTHNEEITRMANRVIRMRNGRTYEVTINRHPVKAEELVW